MITSSPLDPHWRARLIEVQDLVFAAHDVNDLSAAILKLLGILHDEAMNRAAVLLVRDAAPLLVSPEDASPVEIQRWLHAAEQIIGPIPRRRPAAVTPIEEP
jgi:hypothetical protein